MNQWPTASAASVVRVLRHIEPNVLTVEDVGQGNACAFRVDERAPANLWIDVGCPNNLNASTKPKHLDLSVPQSHAPVFLTHWDVDHWRGAKDGVPAANATTFFRRTWIVPRQDLNATHIKFATMILAHGGKILVLDATSAGATFPLKFAVRGGCLAEIALGNGPDVTDRNNNACLVLRVTNIGQGKRKRWLLPGDVSYEYMPVPWQAAPCAAIVASHHGADVEPMNVPPPWGKGALLAFSFGPGNIYKHPKSTMVNYYHSMGWHLDTWLSPQTAGDLVLFPPSEATAQHDPSPKGAHLGKIVIRW